MKQLLITEQCIQQLIQYAQQQAPYEACGIIAASYDKPHLMTQFYPIRNNHRVPLHYFSYDPQHWIDCQFLLIKHNQFIAAYFHSHPNSDAELSKFDLSGIKDFKKLQCIISLKQKDNPQLRLFQYDEINKQFIDYPLMLA